MYHTSSSYQNHIFITTFRVDCCFILPVGRYSCRFFYSKNRHRKNFYHPEFFIIHLPFPPFQLHRYSWGAPPASGHPALHWGRQIPQPGMQLFDFQFIALIILFVAGWAGLMGKGCLPMGRVVACRLMLRLCAVAAYGWG